jgi:hypothetical protein
MTTETPVSYKKSLEGVEATPELTELFQEALKMAHSNKNDEAISKTAAYSTLLEFSANKGKDDGNGENLIIVFPLAVISAIHTVLQKDRIEQALQSSRTKLVFTARPPVAAADTQASKQQERHRTRMERLRWKQEETKYSRLTKNLGTAIEDDDVTTKSMTYAASIGLNMIVAPISFGVFMYFFAGGLLDFFWNSNDAPKHAALQNAPDVKKVIAGVVSGVLMLFIEMILFVIRTNELDRVIRKKGRKKKQGPFGYYSSATPKEFKGE